MAKNSMDLVELLHKRGMDGDVGFPGEVLQLLADRMVELGLVES